MSPIAKMRYSFFSRPHFHPSFSFFLYIIQGSVPSQAIFLRILHLFDRNSPSFRLHFDSGQPPNIASSKSLLLLLSTVERKRRCLPQVHHSLQANLDIGSSLVEFNLKTSTPFQASLGLLRTTALLVAGAQSSANVLSTQATIALLNGNNESTIAFGDKMVFHLSHLSTPRSSLVLDWLLQR